MFLNKTYKAQLRELYGFKKLGIRPSLPPIKKVLKLLGDPHKKTRFFHVAGTNGKGSTVGGIASILQEAGYKTGAFFSPHVTEYRERIQVNGKMISQTEVVNSLAEMGKIFKSALRRKADIPERITFFEWTTALGFFHFASKGVDVAVIETGMGGRFDATNVVNPLATVITNISLEHQIFLGNSRAAIAREKAGIIKRGKPVICGERYPKAADAIRDIAQKRKSPAHFIGEDFLVNEDGVLFSTNFPRVKLSPGMAGRFQIENAALSAMAVLCAKGIKVSPEQIESGISKNRLPGRFEFGKFRSGKIIFDVAHNPASIKELVKNLLDRYPGDTFNIVFGVLKGKDFVKMLKLLAPFARKLAVITPDDFRAVSGVEVYEKADAMGIDAVLIKSRRELLKFLSAGETSVVAGSFTTVEAVKKAIG